MLTNTSNQEFLDLRRRVLEKEFKRMNPMQRSAVFTGDGPVLILAGAGSGKTTVVVNRIAYLIRYGKAYDSGFVPPEVTEEDVSAMRAYLDGAELPEEVKENISVSACPPWKILAITFTNKAAGELKERLCNMLGDAGNDIWASTFHSTCARILRRDGDRLGYSNHFAIYDTDDMRRLMKDVLKQLDISEKNFPVKSVLSEISRAKDTLTSVEEFFSGAGNDFRLKQVARAYELYQKRLKDSDAMDFDDLIVNTVRLFQECPDVLEYYQNRFRYLMVDEYQDTNHAQYMFVRLLAEKSRNICVVGDDDQSIYKFRGATIENILSFEKTFSNAKVIRLEQNYRSTQNILDAANAVIENNTERKGKNLWTDNGSGDKVIIHTAENELDEADKISDYILKMVAEGRKYSDFAVLYRMNSQSLSFERAFAKQGIPHRILGGLRFYERAEIKDMLAYLNVINNPDDEIRLRRIINRPARGIGDRTIETAIEIGQQIGESLFSVISHSEDFPALSRASKKLAAFSAMMKNFMEMAEDETVTINDLYNSIIEATEYKAYLRADDPEKADDKIENIEELSSNIQRYEEEGGTLTEFLEEISLITDIDNYDSDADTVVLMTVHSAKGLEFPVVFLPGWEENVFPGASVMYNPAEVEEERRLAYVAITRAKEKLYITNAESRMIFGMTNRNRISRFCDEIPSDLIERVWSRRRMAPGSNKFASFGSSYSPSGSYGTASPPAANNKFNRSPAAVGGFTAAPKTTPNPAGSFKVGDTVVHKVFGQGLVLVAKQMGGDTYLEVAFDKVGTKKIFANYAKMTKI